MSRTYCYHCGNTLQPQDERSWRCDTCDQTYYENASAGVEAIILNEKDEAVVIRRSAEPYKGKLAFPGGFVDFSETLEEALYREIDEEVGLKQAELETLKYIGSYHALYPWGKDTVRTAVAVYITRIRGDVKLRALDDVSEAKFMTLDSLKPEDFPDFHHYSGIFDTLEEYLKKS